MQLKNGCMAVKLLDFIGQRMAVDALRPSGTDPLELFRSQFRQAQGANDSASTPLAPFL